MNYRKAVRAGIELSQVGLGCNRLGEECQSDRHWVGLVERAVELGINICDTAQGYGSGRSEEILGQALGGREDVYVASKIGHGPKGFKPDEIVSKVEASLNRLRSDRVDILQLHSPSREHLERYDWAEGMQRLEAAGKIRFKAMALDSVESAMWLIEQDIVDFVQITYNIFDIEAERELFALVEEKGVALLGRLPLAQGVLTGKFGLGRDLGDHRARFSGPRLAARIEMAETLRPLAETYPGGMTALAHDFSLGPAAISCTIPGARDVLQLEQNAAAGAREGIDPATREQIEILRRNWSEWHGGDWFPDQQA